MALKSGFFFYKKLMLKFVLLLFWTIFYAINAVQNDSIVIHKNSLIA